MRVDVVQHECTLSFEILLFSRSLAHSVPQWRIVADGWRSASLCAVERWLQKLAISQVWSSKISSCQKQTAAWRHATSGFDASLHFSGRMPTCTRLVSPSASWFAWWTTCGMRCRDSGQIRIGNQSKPQTTGKVCNSRSVRSHLSCRTLCEIFGKMPAETTLIIVCVIFAWNVWCSGKSCKILSPQQPRFFWDKEISLPCVPFGLRSWSH